MSTIEQTILVNDGRQAVVPAAMMTDADIQSLQNPQQFEILWGKITKTIPELSNVVRAADPVPDRVPEAVIYELSKIDPTIDITKIKTLDDIKDIKPKLMKTDVKDIKELINRIKSDPEIREEVKREEGRRYAEGVLEVVAVKNEMIKCENICKEIVESKGRGVTEQLLKDIIQQACIVASRFFSMGIQFKADLIVELQAQATQLGVVTKEVQFLSSQVLNNSQWLANGIKGLHYYQEKMEGQTFEHFKKLFDNLDVTYKKNFTLLDEIKVSVTSTKEEQITVKNKLVELKGQADQLLLQKNEQVGQLTEVLGELKVRTEEVSKAVANGKELRTGMTENIKKYLEYSQTLEKRCNELAQQKTDLQSAVFDLQGITGFLDEKITERINELMQLSQTFTQGNEELKKIGNTGLNDLAKVLGGVARLEQAVADQKQTGAETKTLVANLSKAIKDADLGRVAGLMAAQNQDRPNLDSLISLIQQAVENGLKKLPQVQGRAVITNHRMKEFQEQKEPVMTQQQAMDFIKTVANWYETRANGQASALTAQLTNFTKILDEMRAKINQDGGQRGAQGFNAPIMIVQQVADGLNNLKPIAVPPVIDYGRIQYMTPPERIRELKSLAAQPQWRTKTRTGHGMVPLKSKLIDPALDEGRDVRRTTKARRVARVKKIERRRMHDPLDLFLQGTYK